MTLLLIGAAIGCGLTLLVGGVVQMDRAARVGTTFRRGHYTVDREASTIDWIVSGICRRGSSR